MAKNVLPKWATTVTPFSKYLAMTLFILFPFVGFYFGLLVGVNHPSTPIPDNKLFSSPTETPRAGIVNGGRDAFHPMDFTVHNMWEGPVGSGWRFVYAGGTPKEPGSVDITPVNGTIWMFNGSVGRNLEKFPAPSGTSPLTITAVSGTVLQLRTDTGATLTFDLQTNQYK